eukprot:NODE_124_length_3584_cov_4.703789.p1 GENE.NODE_124_length_3584_cov_4.703789~~NODE_124_length_3584_cov_4.703789.p1  ORF type:complete len:858 (+),score=211.54 NODE_124_length_3584_cov_4.703789:517-3090(+)
MCDIVVPVAATIGTAAFRRAALTMKPFLDISPPLIAPSAPNAADLSDLLWRGPLGRGVRSIFHDVAHTESPMLFNAFVREVIASLGLDANDGLIHLLNASRTFSGTAAVPFTNDTMSVAVTVNAFAIAGLDTFSAIGASVNHTTLAAAGGLAPRGNAGAVVALSPWAEGASVLQLGNMTIRLENNSTLAPIQLAMVGSARVAGGMQLAAAFDTIATSALQLDQLQHASCLPQVVASLPDGPGAELLELRMTAMPLEASVRLADCDEDSLETELLVAGGRIAAALNESLGVVAQQLMDGLASGFVRNRINTAVSNYLASGPQCAPTNFMSGTIRSVATPATYASFVLAAITVFLFVCGLGTTVLPRRRRSRCAATSATTSPLEVASRDRTTEPRQPLTTSASPASRPGLTGMTCSDAEDVDSGRCVSALGRDRAVPPWACVTFVLAVLTTIAIFVVACTTVGIRIAVTATVDGTKQWVSPAIADLSIDNSIQTFYKSHAYPMLFLIVVFSLFWPFAKLLAMVYMWCAPMKAERREHCLLFLDQVGKLSLTDNFVMLILVACCYIIWVGQDVTAADGSTVEIQLLCNPSTEVVLFLLATIMSLVLGHIELAVHRIAQGDFSGNNSRGGVRKPSYVVVAEFWNSRHQRTVAIAGVGIQLTTLALTIVAFVLPCISLNMDGVAGTFLDVTGQSRAVKLSLIGMIGRLSLEHLGYFAYILGFYSVVIPLLASALFLLLWVVPLTYRWRLALITISQTLVAWSSLDILVFALVGVIIGGDAYGIGQFMEFLIYSGNVAPACSALLELDIYCLTLSLHFLPAMSVVILGAIASTAQAQLLMRVMYKANSAARTPCSGESDSAAP